MSTAQQVIDEIGALVDEQMAGGEADTAYSRCRCGAAFRGIADEVNWAWESVRRAFMGSPAPPPSRCTLAARRRMHSDQLRVQRRADRRERRAGRREAECDRLEVHDDHVILTLIPDVSGFRRELRRTYDPS